MTTSDKSRLFALLSNLQECARRGDWKSAHKLAVELHKQNVPANQRDLGNYLGRLRKALVVAKASRAQSAATLARINAVAQFNKLRTEPVPRQEFAEPADC